ncbi:kynureninase [Ahrensia sp. R2A130]|uniref:kynureninase n=1 Tax=Ahrensia sp. R2A130 TaxID=744979 RepID=UPI0001E09C6C|nr:kynureninase [Ahrensia sp. R2A130]EFL88599.1 kynureninase [Ahrensia sp. R2A130]
MSGHFRDLFQLPGGIVYLDGNSLGPLPKSVPAALERVARDEWGTMAIGGWNRAGWMAQPSSLGDEIGKLIGAPAGSVVTGDTLSIKVYQALATALSLQPERRVVLSDNGNFPTDLYMADGLLRSLDKSHELRIVSPEDVLDTITEDAAVVMLTQVDYRTGRMHDMAAITAKAHACSALVIWDLAHSAGAVPVDLAGCEADFAVGCTYKYLNGGPGAPAFIFVRSDHAEKAQPALAGWLGHEAPFAFDLDYRPGAGIERFRVGTPSVLQMAALQASMDIWAQADMVDLREQSIALSQHFIALVEADSPDLKLTSPRDPAQRGSQVSFAFEHGYAVMQALIARGVVGDFRAPNLIRFGFAPLYNTMGDVDLAADTLADIMKSAAWDRPEFHQRQKVT